MADASGGLLLYSLINDVGEEEVMLHQTVPLQLAARDIRFVESHRGIETRIQLELESQRRSSKLLCQAGRLLVALGERLQRAGMPQALPRQELVRGT